MAEIKVEKKKPIWPWVIGGIIILALIGFLMMGDNDNQNRDQSATRTESSDAGTDRNADNRVTREIGTAADNTANQVDKAADRTANAVDNAVDDNQATSANTATSDQAVESFVSYVKSDIRRADLDNQSVKQAFTRLTEATNAKATEVGFQVKNIQTAKANINKISSTAFETAPAESIRETAELITSDLQSIQVAKFPKLDNKVEKLREASTSINPDELAMEQSEEIKDYFTEAAELLEDMK